MSDFSQQYTIPYAPKIESLTGSDFTIDSREKIYLTDGKSIRYVILFYRELEADTQKLRAIQKIFLETGKVGFDNVSFKVCNLSADSKLNTAFNEVRTNPAHPFNWIQNSADPNIFILIYFSGYPQMFYEGPLEKVAFTNFINTFLLGELESKTIFKKYNSGNGFIGVGSKQTYIEQAWSKYTPSGGATDVASSLIKPENIPSGVRAITKGEYVGPPPGIQGPFPKTNEKLKEQKTEQWAEKINQIFKEDNKRIDGMKLPDINLVNTGKNSNRISDAFKDSIYIDYLVTYVNKSDNQLKSLIRRVYDIAKELYVLRGAYNLKAEDIAKLSVNMFGFYRFKKYDPSVKIDKADELEVLYIRDDIVTKNSNGINPIFIQQISKNVANLILDEKGSLKTAEAVEKNFNDNKGKDKNEISFEDALSIVDYFRGKMKELINNEDNKGKDQKEKNNIKRNPDNYDISSDESFPFKSDDIDQKTNEQLEKLINDDYNVKKFIINKIMGENQQSGGQPSEGGGGSGGGTKPFGGGGGRRGGRAGI
jgi:uncharacterized membrane protein YgcG